MHYEHIFHIFPIFWSLWTYVSHFPYFLVIMSICFTFPHFLVIMNITLWQAAMFFISQSDRCIIKYHPPPIHQLCLICIDQMSLIFYPTLGLMEVWYKCIFLTIFTFAVIRLFLHKQVQGFSSLVWWQRGKKIKSSCKYPGSSKNEQN
jgi:hypothetical protein